METLDFEYEFSFDDGTSQKFSIQIDAKLLVVKDDPNYRPPDWTLLEFKQCGNCPYSVNEKKHCPVALGLARVAESFRGETSHRETTVTVRGPSRLYQKRTDVQIGLQSLFGLTMGASDCRHMDLFKPMVQFHLPFATFDETIIRVIGNYLVEEYLRIQDHRAGTADLELEGLKEAYRQVNLVNQGMINRIRAVAKGDADRNAIIILDSFASLLPLELEGEKSVLRRVFLKEGAEQKESA
ncbi:MAG: hypothetical protein C5B49_08425 [Bdellovibrio sp.]|nr:MAG: hypothetical protein C5B49_08425 [Bdellovibrio sp.]